MSNGSALSALERLRGLRAESGLSGGMTPPLTQLDTAQGKRPADAGVLRPEDGCFPLPGVSYPRTGQPFAASAQVIAVRSAALGGETVLLAGAAADVGLWVFERPQWRECVVYQGAELAALAGVAPDQLRMLHALKKAFGGEVTW